MTDQNPKLELLADGARVLAHGTIVSPGTITLKLGTLTFDLMFDDAIVSSELRPEKVDDYHARFVFPGQLGLGKGWRIPDLGTVDLPNGVEIPFELFVIIRQIGNGDQAVRSVEFTFSEAVRKT